MKNTQKLKLTVWKDKKGEFRWHAKRAGRIVAESGEGYKRVQACTKALCNMIRSIEALNYEWVQLEKVPSTSVPCIRFIEHTLES